MAKRTPATEEEKIARKYAKMDERLQHDVKEIEDDLRAKFGTVHLREPRIVSPATWKEDYARVGVRHISETDKVPYGPGVIYVHPCTQDKSDLPRGVMQDMYIGKANQRFYKYMEEEGLRFGTVSGHLGIVEVGEEFDTYDLHTSFMIFEEILMDYGMHIAEQCHNQGITTIVIVKSSPCMCCPFIKRLLYARKYAKEMFNEDIEIDYVTKLSVIRNPEKHPEEFPEGFVPKTKIQED